MKKASENRSGGVNIHGSANVQGDVVGRDKMVIGTQASAEITRQFAEIKRLIAVRPPDTNVDKTELRETAEKIEQEVRKGDNANPDKVERWLVFLAQMSHDIFEVTATTLANPVAGIAKVVQLVAQKAETEFSS